MLHEGLRLSTITLAGMRHCSYGWPLMFSMEEWRL
jgi:hypothetical protein